MAARCGFWSTLLALKFGWIFSRASMHAFAEKVYFMRIHQIHWAFVTFYCLQNKSPKPFWWPYSRLMFVGIGHCPARCRRSWSWRRGDSNSHILSFLKNGNAWMKVSSIPSSLVSLEQIQKYSHEFGQTRSLADLTIDAGIFSACVNNHSIRFWIHFDPSIPSSDLALHKLPFFQVFAQSVLLGCGGWMNGVIISDKNKNLDGFKKVIGKKLPDVSIPENQKSVTKKFPCPRNRVHAESPGFELEVLEDYLLLRGILNVRSEVYEFYIVLCSVQMWEF